MFATVHAAVTRWLSARRGLGEQSGKVMKFERDAEAYVNEVIGLMDLRYTGTFEAQVQFDDGARVVRGPSGVSLDDAVAWSRERAPVVLVTMGNSERYSAGAHQSSRGSLPVLPADLHVPPRDDPDRSVPDGDTWVAQMRLRCANAVSCTEAVLARFREADPGSQPRVLEVRDDEIEVAFSVEARNRVLAAEHASGVLLRVVNGLGPPHLAPTSTAVRVCAGGWAPAQLRGGHAARARWWWRQVLAVALGGSASASGGRDLHLRSWVRQVQRLEDPWDDVPGGLIVWLWISPRMATMTDDSERLVVKAADAPARRNRLILGLSAVLVALVLSVGIAATSGGSGGGDAQQDIRAAYGQVLDGYKTHDGAHVCDASTPEARRRLEKAGAALQDLGGKTTDCASVAAKLGTGKAGPLSKIKVDGDNATGQSEEGTVTFQKVGDSWKVGLLR